MEIIPLKHLLLLLLLHLQLRNHPFDKFRRTNQSHLSDSVIGQSNYEVELNFSLFKLFSCVCRLRKAPLPSSRPETFIQSQHWPTNGQSRQRNPSVSQISAPQVAAIEIHIHRTRRPRIAPTAICFDKISARNKLLFMSLWPVFHSNVTTKHPPTACVYPVLVYVCSTTASPCGARVTVNWICLLDKSFVIH